MNQAIQPHEHAVGGLSHLMEAATALAKLTGGAGAGAGASTASASPVAAAVEEQHQPVAVSDEEDTSKSSSSDAISKLPPASRREIFPERLMAILNDASLSDIITWLPHGRSFVIIRPDVFTEKVLPKYLPPVDARGSTKYPSFTRKLNRWGFRQATRGADTGAFHHPLFRRDQPSLCLDMVCQRSRDRKRESAGAAAKKGVAAAAAASAALPPKKRMSARAEEGKTSSLPLQLEPKPCLLRAVSPSDSPAPAAPPTAASTVGQPVAATVAIPATQAAATLVSEMTSPSLATLPQGISSDEAFVRAALQQRNELERIRVAKIMLYQSFLQAMQRK